MGAFSTNAKPDRWGHNKPWRQLYNCKRWKDLREVILHRDPVCKKCGRRASTVADHIKDHKGNIELFYAMWNLQGLCKPCHDEKTGLTSHEGQSPDSKLPKATAVGDAALDAALRAYANAETAGKNKCG